MARTHRYMPGTVRILTHGSMLMPSIGIGLWVVSSRGPQVSKANKKQ